MVIESIKQLLFLPDSIFDKVIVDSTPIQIAGQTISNKSIAPIIIMQDGARIAVTRPEDLFIGRIFKHELIEDFFKW